MTRTRKIDLLYAIAKGKQVSISPEERKEIKKYKVDSGEYAFYTTKKNISAYLSAVDNGNARLSYRDWCLNNHLADRRRSGSDDKSIAKDNRAYMIGWAVAGGVFWMMCLAQVFGTASTACIFGGMVISVFLSVISRKYVAFTNILLPLVIIVVSGLLKK